MAPSPRAGGRPPGERATSCSITLDSSDPSSPLTHHASHASLSTLTSLDSTEFEAIPPSPEPTLTIKHHTPCSTRVAAFLINAAGLLAVGALLFAAFLALRASSSLFLASTACPPLAPQRSFISISADDFGRFADSVPLQPSLSFINDNPGLQLVTRRGFTPWYTRASVETVDDLRNLQSTLAALNANVSFEQKVVLTPHFVVGGPDFRAMKETGCGKSAAAHRTSSAGDAAAQWSSSAPRHGSRPGPSSPESPSSSISHSSVSESADHLPDSPSSPHSQTSSLQSTNSPAEWRHARRHPPLHSHPEQSSNDPSLGDNDNRLSAVAATNLRTAIYHDSKPRVRPTAVSSSYASCTYAERLLSRHALPGSAGAPFSRGDLRPLYDALYKDGLWHPEFHGRAHFNVPAWISALRSGDLRAIRCFRKNMVCATNTVSLRSEFTGFSSVAEMKSWLDGGVKAFKEYFGYQPLVISSPHNAWSSWLADAALKLGFIGAELAEDQEAYIAHSPLFSLHDRFRFDVFFPGFHCDRAIDEVVKLLRVPGPKTLRDHWYDFLSLIDLFRVHYVPYHHSPGGNHERFLSLMWHAQNAMSSTYTPEEHSSYMACMERAVHTVRNTLPRTVFVTASELHQIRVRGWSVETWHDRVVLRNYATRAVDATVPDVVGAVSAPLQVVSGDVSEDVLPTQVVAGEKLVIPPDSVLQILVRNGETRSR